MADPEGRLSAERLALIRQAMQRRSVVGDTAPLRRAGYDGNALVAEIDRLLAAIDTLEAERDAATKRADEWYAHAKRAVAEGDELRARAAADAPKLQAAQAWADAVRAAERAQADRPGATSFERIAIADAADALAALFPPTQPAQEEP